MVIERKRWVRAVLIGQPVLAWPCSWLFFLTGGPLGLALAVVVLWASALTCVFGIIRAARADCAAGAESPRELHRSGGAHGGR